jgi:hypothetical protein
MGRMGTAMELEKQREDMSGQYREGTQESSQVVDFWVFCLRLSVLWFD